jgi:hypothetical protein
MTYVKRLEVGLHRELRGDWQRKRSQGSGAIRLEREKDDRSEPAVEI